MRGGKLGPSRGWMAGWNLESEGGEGRGRGDSGQWKMRGDQKHG